MKPEEVITESVHAARAVLLHHVQTKQGREPEKAIDELRDILESTAVSEALNKLRK
jgi:hypothetical protein